MRITKQEAYELAAKLKNSMKNPNIWKIRVHENFERDRLSLGWFYCITCGNISVQPSGDKYYAMVGSIINEYSGGAPAFWTDKESYTSPQVAAEKAVQKAIDVSMEYLTAAVAAKALLQ